MNFLFLHGALGCASHWNEVANTFSPYGKVFNLDFPGHGQSELAPVSKLEDLSEFISGFVQSNQIESPVVVGYSMGGYAALHAASKGKLNASKIVTIATKMNWDVTIAEEEAAKLTWDNLAVIKDKLLAEHGKNTEHLLSMTASVLKSIGQNPILQSDLAQIRTPVTMLVGEKDKMVSKEETESSAIACKNGQFAILEAQGHLLERMDQLLLSQSLKQLLIH